MLKYSTDPSVYRKQAVNTDRWKPSKVWAEVQTMDTVIGAPPIQEPKYIYDRIIRRPK